MNTESIADKDESNGSQHLSIQEKIGYGLGDTASNFYWKLFENFQLIFYTDVFGISAAAAATMFFVTKLWDAINDPMVGFLADRTKTAWGRFRPYLIWMSIPFAVTGILTFYTPDLSPTGKLIYAYVTYTLVFMAYTAINIPYGALMGVISSNSLERTTVSTYRFVLAFCGGLVVQKFTEPLVKFFGGSKEVVVDGVSKTVAADPQTGFFWTVVCYALAAIVLFTITFLTTKERVEPEQKHNTAFWRDVMDLFQNRPWLVLLVVGLFQILAGWTRGSATGYYFYYFVGGGNTDFGTFLVAGTIGSIAGMLLTAPLVRIFGNKLLMILIMAANGLCMAGFFLLGPDQIALMYTLHVLGAFLSGPMPILLWAMYADVADYSEWVHHRRATGLVFAAATFSQKLGSALGAAVPGWALAAFSFQAPIDNVRQVQTQQTIEGIIALMSLVPAGFLACGCIAMMFYNITPKFLIQIEKDLRARKATNATS
jgi:GPH family glycoside/pentoside/hexuronide:cation symporter